MRIDKKRVKRECYVFIQKKYQKKIKRELADFSDFSILSNNCAAGMTYHDLGRRFLSPTINLWISPYDFVKFSCNLDYYIERSLEFIDGTDKKYPVATLGEGEEIITIYFNHYTSRKEAEEKWEERKKRIIKRATYLVISDDTPSVITDEMIERLSECGYRRIIIFSKEPREQKEVYMLKGLKNLETSRLSVAEKSRITFLPIWENEVDIAKWIKGNSDFTRKGMWKWSVVLNNILIKRKGPWYC